MPGFRSHGTPSVTWWAGDPSTGPVGTSSTWVGVKLDFTVPGRVFGMRAYMERDRETAMLMVLAEDVSKTIIAAKVARSDITTSTRWVQAWIRPSFRITVGTIYRLAVCYIGGHYFRTNNGLSSPQTHGPIIFEQSFLTTSLDIGGVAITTNVNAHAVDVLFQPDE